MDDRDPMDSGLCCITRHANAVPPWTCDCPCHKRILDDVMSMIETLKANRRHSPSLMYLPDEGIRTLGGDPNDYPELEGYPGLRVVEMKAE